MARAPVQIGVIGRNFVEVTSGLRPGATVLDPPTTDTSLATGRRWSTAR